MRPFIKIGIKTKTKKRKKKAVWDNRDCKKNKEQKNYQQYFLREKQKSKKLYRDSGKIKEH